MPSECLFCPESPGKVVFVEHGIDVLRCRRCGHVYSSHQTPRDYDGFFGYGPIAESDQFWWDRAHKRMYDAFARRFLRGRSGQCLDVGCGLGYFVRAAQVEGWRSFGCEISPPAARFARERLGLTDVFCGPLERGPYERGSFDIVTMWDVIEHLSDPRPMLATIASLLKPGGLLFIHTPNARLMLFKARVRKLLRGMRDGVHYLEARDHMNLYSPAHMKRLLAQGPWRDVRLIHLPPIQSISGSRDSLRRGLKNAYFAAARAMAAATAGRVNLDNLFVTARRQPLDATGPRILSRSG